MNIINFIYRIFNYLLLIFNINCKKAFHKSLNHLIHEPIHKLYLLSKILTMNKVFISNELKF